MSHNTTPITTSAFEHTAPERPSLGRRLATLGVGTAAVISLTGCTANDTDAKPTPTPGDSDHAFIAMPFRADEGKDLVITQGDSLSPDDARVLGSDGDHSAAIDIEGIRCGGDILAPYDGTVVTGYQLVELRGGKPFNPDNPTDPETNFRNPNNGQEGPVFATGLFTEVIAATKNNAGEVVGGVEAPSGGYYSTLIVHMGSAATGIPRVESVPNGEVMTPNGSVTLWHPKGVVAPQSEIIAKGKSVRKGEVIGTVGNSGIGLTGDSYDPTTHTVNPHNTPSDLPWDPPTASIEEGTLCQTHISVSGARTPAPGLKRQDHTDMLDNKAVISGIQGEPGYDNPLSPQPGIVAVGKNALLQVHPGGRPVFADE